MAGKGSRNVTYAVQEEPAFIRRFKEKIGYKEDPGIEEKRQKLPAAAADSGDDDDDDEVDDCADDEKPVVVVLRPGDLTAEEAQELAAREGQQEPGGESYGRIVFRKPSKRSSESNAGILSASSTSKKLKSDVSSSSSSSHTDSDSSTERSKHGTDKTSDKGKLNACLLSFHDDEVDNE